MIALCQLPVTPICFTRYSPARMEKSHSAGLNYLILRFSNCTFKKRFVAAGLNGRELVKVAYSPDCLDTVYLYENGDYIPFTLAQKIYLGKSLAEIADMQQNREKRERKLETAGIASPN